LLDAQRARKGPLFFVNGVETAIHKLTTGHPQPGAGQAPNSKRFLPGPVEKSIVAEIYFSVAERVCLRCAPGGKQNKWPRYSRLHVPKFLISKS
jgi:hypothetical protein